MAIDGFSFNTIANSRVDPDSPGDTTLFTDIRDALEFLMRWLGRDYLAGAVANHTHDGLNSGGIGGATGGKQIFVGYEEATALALRSAKCRFIPDVMFSCKGNATAPWILSHVNDPSGISTTLNGTASKISNGITGLKLGGALFPAATGLNDTVGVPLPLVGFKEKTGLIAYGEYLGNGTTQSPSIGFQADLILVWRKTDTAATGPCIRTKGFTGSNSRLCASGNLTTTGITAIGATTFTVGALSNVNANGVDFVYLAIKSGSADGEIIQVDSYAGNGSTPRTLTNTQGFAPQAVIIVNTSTTGRNIVMGTVGMDTTKDWGSTGTMITADILNYLETGVEVGNSTKVNGAAENYDAIYILGGTRP